MLGISPDIIAVIGAGASGTLVATQLMRHAQRPLHLLLIERHPLIGRGVAYGTTNAYHLLNTPAKKMSAYQDKSDHFVDWLKQHHDLLAAWEATTAYSYVPRYVYGAYLQAVLVTAHALMRWVQDEINQVTSKGIDWRCVIDALIPSIQSLWQELPIEEKSRFLRHVRPYWDVLRHRIAPAIAMTLDQLRAAGQLQVYAGRVRSYEEGKDDVAVTFALRHTRKELVVRAGLVINCTGLNSDIRSFDHPLIVNLLEQGLIRPGVLGIGMATTIKGALVNAEGYSSSWLWTLGSLRRGQLWETTAVSEIRQQAEQLALDVLKQVNDN